MNRRLQPFRQVLSGIGNLTVVTIECGADLFVTIVIPGEKLTLAMP